MATTKQILEEFDKKLTIDKGHDKPIGYKRTKDVKKKEEEKEE